MTNNKENAVPQILYENHKVMSTIEINSQLDMAINKQGGKRVSDTEKHRQLKKSQH